MFVIRPESACPPFRLGPADGMESGPRLPLGLSSDLVSSRDIGPRQPLRLSSGPVGAMVGACPPFRLGPDAGSDGGPRLLSPGSWGLEDACPPSRLGPDAGPMGGPRLGLSAGYHFDRSDISVCRSFVGAWSELPLYSVGARSEPVTHFSLDFSIENVHSGPSGFRSAPSAGPLSGGSGLSLGCFPLLDWRGLASAGPLSGGSVRSVRRSPVTGSEREEVSRWPRC